jgi:molybdate transport system ATP-binding protein
LRPATPAQKRRVAQVLTEVGLAGWSERAFLTLSYGQRRRVLLARAVVREPDVLLLDEALNGLDAKGRAAFRRALRRIASSRTAYVFSSHRAADAPPDVTHVARIRGGRVSVVSGENGDVSRSPEAAAILRPGTNRSSPSEIGKRPCFPRVRASARELLRLERAAVFRGELPVIGAFDWTLRDGEHWRLSGANGAGKSTLIALLYGDLWPAHGGQRLRRWVTAEDWKARVGLVSPELQATYAATGCTVEEIVASGLHASIGLNEVPTPAELRRVRRELRAWQLDALAARRARELSYGQLRRVLAARAFIRPRRLYLLDEPFDGLDADARMLLRARLDRAMQRGATIVMATHHDEDVPPYVHRTLVLRRGRRPRSSQAAE